MGTRQGECGRGQRNIHSKELPLEAFTPLSEQHEENSPCRTIETHLEVSTWGEGLKVIFVRAMSKKARKAMEVQKGTMA